MSENTGGHWQLLSTRSKLLATRSESKNRPIVADNLPASLRFPCFLADFGQNTYCPGAFSEIGANVTEAFNLIKHYIVFKNIHNIYLEQTIVDTSGSLPLNPSIITFFYKVVCKKNAT